jgi:hypothetical protein
MPVTRQVYNATATWTAAQLADTFRSAFIDAGLMTDWFDSFLSGSIENRILEVVYDAAKTYGKTYYWFQFTTGGVFLNHASGWNATTKVPTGTALVDFVSATTNATTFHSNIFGMNNTVTTTVTRFTSQVNANHTWFLVRNASSSLCFAIEKGVTISPFIDLDKCFYTGYQTVGASGSLGGSWVSFSQACGVTRRAYFGGAVLGTASNDFAYLGGYTYGAPRNESGTGISSSTAAGLLLPIAFSASNPAYATNKIPIFNGVLVSYYSSMTIPADFGIMPHYPNNTMAIQDKMIVTAGVEEWEILRVFNSTSTPGRSSIMFVARTV